MNASARFATTDAMSDRNELMRSYALGAGRRSSHGRSFSNHLDAAFKWGLPAMGDCTGRRCTRRKPTVPELLRDARLLIIDDCMLTVTIWRAVLSSYGARSPGVRMGSGVTDLGVRDSAAPGDPC